MKSDLDLHEWLETGFHNWNVLLSPCDVSQRIAMKHQKTSLSEHQMNQNVNWLKNGTVHYIVIQSCKIQQSIFHMLTNEYKK